MAVSEVIPVFPTIESLCDPIKGRPRSSIKNDAKKVYHCPIQTCKYYHKDHHFEKMKFLRQHFVKVHKTRTFSCDKCGVQFPLESTLSHHKLICGVSYQCYCNAEYRSYEALLTHFKRKHNVNACVKYKDMMGLLKAHSTAQNFQKSVDNVVDVRAIVMKNWSRQKLFVLKEKKNKTALSKETQTGMKMCKILPNNVHNQSSEISEDQLMKKTVSMQTTSEFVQKKRKRNRVHNSINGNNNDNSNKTNCPASNKVSFSTSSTQTTPVKENQSASYCVDNRTKCEILPNILFEDSSSSASFGENFKTLEQEKLKDETASYDTPAQLTNFEDNCDSSNSESQFSEKRMISAEDPNLGFTPLCNGADETNNVVLEDSRADLNSLEFVMNDLMKTDLNLIMCSDSETQTAFEDYFDSSYMDTYTQTCDSLFSDLDFVDIETQTF